MGRESSTEAARQPLQLEASARVIADVTLRFAEVTTDYTRLLESIARCLAESLQDACTVFLVSEDGTNLELSSVHATDARVLAAIRGAFAGAPLPVSEQESLRRVVTTGEAILIPQLPVRLTASAAQSKWAATGLHSALLVPIRAQQRVIGVLTLGRFAPTLPPFHESDLTLAQTLADHAALSIENSRLYAAAEAARKDAQQSEEAMRKTEVAHRQFFETSPNPSFVIDVETLRILEVNQAALLLYGYSRAEFLGLELHELRGASSAEELREAIARLGTAATRATSRHRHKDGSIIHIEGSSHQATFEGRPARMVTINDQTPRIRAETERDALERRLQRTIDGLREGYAILDRNLRYVYVNRAGAALLPLPQEQVLGRSPAELLPRAHKLHRALEEALATGAPQRLEEEFALSDGQHGYFELNIQPVPEGLVVLSVDQTARREAERRRDALEEQLRQAQKLEAVGKLAGGVAHDFNNVLSVILGYAEDLLQSRDLTASQAQDLSEIQAAAQRAAGLTRQLLMFSRQQVVVPKVLSLNQILSDMQRMLARAIGERVEFSLRPAPDLGRIRADQGNIEQVIVNLAVNARDAMPNGGRLMIETANIVADELFEQQHLGCKPGPYVVLAVTDTGLGMDAETRARIFEPFFSTKGAGTGTGLGLSTVLGIVQQAGGGVWVYSEPGRGTTVKVYLPRVDAELDTPLPPEQAIDLRGTETILLVEDEAPVREVARRILERQGYTVLVAPSPGEALHLGREHAGPIDLLLTDVVMPRLSGSELARALLEVRPDLRVLYVSGYTDGTIDGQVLLTRGTAFLQKPFTTDLLCRKVRGLLDGTTPTRPPPEHPRPPAA
jgi:two-component system, cell cycle sensor histidine kinase and response regulator CckA